MRVPQSTTLIRGEGPSWSLLDLYDDTSTLMSLISTPTTSFYDDLDEEEEEEEEDKDAVGGGDLEDENDLVPTEKPGLGPGLRPAHQSVALSLHSILWACGPGSSIASGTAQRRQAGTWPLAEMALCAASGFVRHNGSCRSVCDLFPSYCHNGGQCYLVENIGAFCR